MTKNERKKFLKIVVTVVVIVAVLTIVGCITLYFTTDMLKSNKKLFLEYATQGIDNLEAATSILESNEKSENEKSNIKTEYSINYTDETETENPINNLKIVIEEDLDKTENYNYKNVKLMNEDEKIQSLEYIQSGEQIGIRALDIKQFLYANASSIKELAKKLNFTDEQVEQLPDITKEQLPEIKFTEGEIETLKKRYIEAIFSNLNKANFKKQSKQTVTIGGETVVANAYMYQTTKEQINSIYIKWLEIAKEDEIILSKLEEFQKLLDKISIVLDQESDLKTQYVVEIEKIIEKIHKNNIGNEITAIKLYEKNGQTIDLEMQGIDNIINIGFIEQDGQKVLEYHVSEEEKTIQKITINKTETEKNIYIEDNNRIKPIKITINEINGATSLEYEIDQKKLEIKKTKQVNNVNEIENKITFNSTNSLQIDNIEEEKQAQLSNVIKQQSEKVYSKLAEKIDIDNIEKILNVIGLKNTVSMIESGTQITEAQKNRFNAKFEFLQGKEIDTERTLEEIETFKGNITDFHVISSDVLKIEVDRINSEDKRIEYLKEFMKEDMSRKFDISLEYDQETGLVKYVVMTIVKQKK